MLYSSLSSKTSNGTADDTLITTSVTLSSTEDNLLPLMIVAVGSQADTLVILGLARVVVPLFTLKVTTSAPLSERSPKEIRCTSALVIFLPKV